MAIKKPSEMNFSNKHLILILSGLPGTGKSTLAASAPKALMADLDDGLARMKAEHRIDASVSLTYEEFLADLKAAEGEYETIIIDNFFYWVV